MARFYHVDIARHAVGADAKWLDNLLSPFDVPRVQGGTSREARRITPAGIYHIALIRPLTRDPGPSAANTLAPPPTPGISHIALIRLLTRDRGLSVATAVATSVTLLGVPEASPASIAVSPALELRLDRAQFFRQVDFAIDGVVESVVPTRRGRPPG